MKKAVKYKTNLTKQELRNLIKEEILKEYKKDYNKMIAIAQMLEEEDEDNKK